MVEDSETDGTFCGSECIEKFGDVVGNQIWESINDCFDAMPIAAVVDEKVDHGTCLSTSYLDFSFAFL